MYSIDEKCRTRKMNAMVNYRRTFVVKYAGYVEDSDNEAGFGEAECPIKVRCVTVA